MMTDPPICPANDEFIPTRQSLLSRLKDWNDQESWRRFFDLYGRLIYNVARKAGLSDSDAQDIVQETVIAVARKLPEFTYNPALGSFKGWLLQISRRRIADLLRTRNYRRNGEVLPRHEPLGTSLLEKSAASDESPFDAIWEEQWQSNLIAVASAKVKLRVRPAWYQIFYLHVECRQPAREVSKRLGVTRAQVYFASRRIAAMLKREMKAISDHGF